MQTVCKLIEVLLTHPDGPSLKADKQKLNPLLAMTFVFSMVWGLAGGSIEANWDKVDAFVRNLFDDLGDARVGVVLGLSARQLIVFCLDVYSAD